MPFFLAISIAGPSFAEKDFISSVLPMRFIRPSVKTPSMSEMIRVMFCIFLFMMLLQYSIFNYFQIIGHTYSAHFFVTSLVCFSAVLLVQLSRKACLCLKLHP